MLDIIVERLRQKARTVPFPKALPTLAPRFRGRPFIDAALCGAESGQGSHRGCTRCRDVCPMSAITLEERGPALDMGMCTFCGECARACARESSGKITDRSGKTGGEAEGGAHPGALVFTTDWRLASTDRAALIIRPAVHVPGEHGAVTQSLPECPGRTFALPSLPLAACTAAGGAFARSFRLRQVTAAGCGACEADLNVLGTVVFDIGRFGMDFVASPRHADGLALTGPVPRNMREALGKCYAAMPDPKAVIAVGACAISGGMFRALPGGASEQRAEGALAHLSVDLYIPGCPPHPYTILDGLLRFVGRTAPLHS